MKENHNIEKGHEQNISVWAVFTCINVAHILIYRYD